MKEIKVERTIYLHGKRFTVPSDNDYKYVAIDFRENGVNTVYAYEHKPEPLIYGNERLTWDFEDLGCYANLGNITGLSLGKCKTEIYELT